MLSYADKLHNLMSIFERQFVKGLCLSSLTKYRSKFGCKIQCYKLNKCDHTNKTNPNQFLNSQEYIKVVHSKEFCFISTKHLNSKYMIGKQKTSNQALIQFVSRITHWASEIQLLLWIRRLWWICDNCIHNIYKIHKHRFRPCYLTVSIQIKTHVLDRYFIWILIFILLWKLWHLQQLQQSQWPFNKGWHGAPFFLRFLRLFWSDKCYISMIRKLEKWEKVFISLGALKFGCIKMSLPRSSHLTSPLRSNFNIMVGVGDGSSQMLGKIVLQPELNGGLCCYIVRFGQMWLIH